MPELPDLQAFSQNLTKLLAGKTIRSVRTVRPGKLNVSPRKLSAALRRARITDIRRAGKELHILFDNENILGLHMMLRGQLHLFEKKNENKYPIIELLFTDGSGLAMSDFQGQATPTLNPPPHDGVDALSPRVNYRFLKQATNGSRATIKNLLLDQHVTRGIGNAYADEILWACRISPFSIAGKIPDAQLRKLSTTIRKVLKDATKNILKSNPGIISGEIRDFLSVHHPKKEKSPTGGVIRVQTTGGRKTYFTDEQKLYQ